MSQSSYSYNGMYYAPNLFQNQQMQSASPRLDSPAILGNNSPYYSILQQQQQQQQQLMSSPHQMQYSSINNSMANGNINPAHVTSIANASNSKNIHIQKQLELAKKSRNSSSPHHNARVAAAVARASNSTHGNNNNSNNSNSSNNTEKEAGQWTILDFGGMAIKNISLELFKYTFLTTLYLNHNKLLFIPPEISNLKSLNVLDISGNKLTYLPPEMGLLSELKELYLFDNIVAELPNEFGFLFKLEILGIEGNPINEKIVQHLQQDGTQGVIVYLRDKCQVPPPPEKRKWIAFDDEPMMNDRYLVMTYNILSDKYASPQSYAYTPSWVLNWENRSKKIIKEILEYSPDIICLQEVEMSQYHDLFTPQLSEYTGVFWPKSRAKTMQEYEKKTVDGCATFFKTRRFNLIEQDLIEFNQTASQNPESRKYEDIYNRVMTKDNIAVVILLEDKETNFCIMVTNTHLHWDPAYKDVKLVQATILMEELQKFSDIYMKRPLRPQFTKYLQNDSTRFPLIICGDFNSEENSGVYEFLSKGKIAPDHEDYLGHSYGTEEVTHKLQLKSAYTEVNDLEFTNYTPGFKGILDYIWYTSNTIKVTGALGPVDKQYMKKVVGFPEFHFPSDHIPLLTQIKIKNQIPPHINSAAMARQAQAAQQAAAQNRRN